MRTTCLWILSMFLIHSSFAQMKEPVNSGELLKKAVKLHDENKFKEAVALFRQIPRNDTNYVLALYEQALSLQADSNYPAALQAVRLGLETGDEDQELLLLTLRASIVDDTGNTAGAVALYDSALMKYPRAQNLRLNKAVSLMRLNKYTDAEKLLQQILVSNPYYSSAHFRLGQCALQRGDLIPALMCFYTYLLNSPAGPYSQASIKLLGNISKGLDDVRELVAQRTAGPSGNLALVEQIVLSKIAMDKGYKVKTELDDPIIRQLQVLMEKLEYDAESDNFYMQFYVPYLTDIFRQGLFEPAVYRAFNDVDIEIIQRYNKKNQKQISAATSVIITSLQSIQATGELNFNKRKSLSALYHYDDGQLIGKGRLENDKTVGAWEFYYTNGNLKSSGMYNAQGLKVGTWNYYTATGKVLGVDNWKEGKQEGEDLIYNLQGVLQTKAQYQNGKLQGERFTYHVPGHLNVASDFKQGVEEGTFRQFYDNGRKKIVAGSQNDQLHGAYRSYFISGQLESEAQYQQGKLHGTYKSYHENGQLEFETSYQNGELNGLTKTYHDNGKLLRTITYVNNLAEGEEVKYYKDGTIEEKSNYKKGKSEGLSEYFDTDGKLFSTYLFDNNKLKTATYFNKSGKEFSTSIRRGNTIELTSYNPEGKKSFYGVFKDKRDKPDTLCYYYPSGAVRETNSYKDGMLHGVCRGYYSNGQKEYEVAYRENEKDGASIYYHPNGKLKTTIWYKNGQVNGDWTEYNEMGNRTSLTTYLDGDIYGTRQYFLANGKTDYEESFRSGYLLTVAQFDSTGKVSSHVKLDKYSGTYKAIYPNGRTRFEGTMDRGMLQGVYTNYFYDGSVQIKKNFLDGLLEGNFTEYHHGGNIATQGMYKNGQRTGPWKRFNQEGKQTVEENYVNGSLQGTNTYYYSNGKVERIMEYRDNQAHGEMKRFSPDGQLQYVLKYQNGIALAYSYYDKTGKPVPFIPIASDKTKIVTYFSNGQKSAEMEYSDREITGTYNIYYSDGRLYYTDQNVQGKSLGKVMEYFPGGKPKYEYSLLYDTYHDAYKEYHENGKLKEEGIYYCGVRHGAFTSYDQQGKQVRKKIYYYGLLINVTP